MTDPKIAVYQELVNRNAVPPEHMPVVNELVRRGVLKQNDGLDPKVPTEIRGAVADQVKNYKPGIPSPAATIPFAKELMAGANAGLHTLSGGSIGAPYDVSLWKYREQDRRDREESPVAAGAATVGGMLAVPVPGPTPAASFGGRVLQNAVVGGGVGAVAGAAEGDPGLEGRLRGAEEGAIGGAVMGPLIGAGLEGFFKGKQWLNSRSTAAANRANEAQGVFDEAGVPAFGPALGNGATKATAGSLMGSIGGGPLRESAAATQDAIGSRLNRTVEGLAGTRSTAEAGDELKGMLRRQLTERSRTPEEIAAMPPERRQDISGISPRQDYTPQRVPVTPTSPKPVSRVSEQQYLDEVRSSVHSATPRYPEEIKPNVIPEPNLKPTAIKPIEPKYPTFDETPVPTEAAKALQAAHSEVQRLAQLHDDHLLPALDKAAEDVFALRQKAIEANLKNTTPVYEIGKGNFVAVPLPQLSTDPRPKRYVGRVGEIMGRIKDHQGVHEGPELYRRDIAQGADWGGVYPDKWSDLAQAALPGHWQKQIAAAETRWSDINGQLGKLKQQHGTASAEVTRLTGEADKARQAAWADSVKKSRSAADAETARLEAEVSRELEARSAQHRAAVDQERQRVDAINSRGRIDAESEAARRTEALRQELVDRAKPEAARMASERTREAQTRAVDEARLETARRQTAADAAQDADVARRVQKPTDGPIAGRNRGETYKTEFDAAYTQAFDNAGSARGNVMGGRNEPPRSTATSSLIDDLAQRGVGIDPKMRGYKRGNLFGEDGKGPLDPRVSAHIKDVFGQDIGASLEELATARARSWASPNMQKLRDLRTQVGRAIGNARKAYDLPAGAAKPGNVADLERLYGALSDDIQAITRRVPGGDRAADQIAHVDREFRSYMETVRQPLSKLFGEKVTAEQAIDRLVKATQNNGDSALVRAYFRVAYDKGDPARATGAILARMAQDGLPAFMKAYRNLSPEARAVMFQGPTLEVGRTIDALVRAGGLMEKFARNIQFAPDLSMMIRPHNILTGMLAMVHVPSAMASVIGTAAMSKTMSSPSFAAWLKKYPAAVARGPQSLEFKAALEGFEKLLIGTGVSKEAGHEIVRSIMPSSAQAGFLGEGSRTADKAALSSAKDMDRKGASPKEIWSKTGWWKDSGRWFYEGADGQYDDDASRSGKDAQFKDVMKGSDTEKAYPDVAGMRVSRGGLRDDYWADYTPGFEWKGGRVNRSIRLHKDADPTRSGAAMVHETQHAVDDTEGLFSQYFGKGTDNAGYYGNRLERRAFNAEYRAGLSPEDRKARAPFETEGEAVDAARKRSTSQTVTSLPRKRGDEAPADQQPNGKAPSMFTSLEAPPSPSEVRQQVKSGVMRFDIDLNHPDAAASVAEIKRAGGQITAYHVGGGGGRAWSKISDDEKVNKFDTPEALAKLTDDVKGLVAKGADSIHFDNTHRMSGKKLEAIADAIKAGGAGFIAKNNADKWNLVMRRRPDLKPDYAVVEAAMHDADETQAASDLHAKGVPVYIIGFKKTLDGKHSVTPEYAKEYQKANPWAHVILMEDENAYDQRTQHKIGD